MTGLGPGIEVTGWRLRDAWRTGEPATVERVADGIWSVPVPIPNSPLRYVLSYAIEHRGGVLLVDPGWPSEEALRSLEDGLAQMGAAVTDVTGILVTHAHTDHHGLARDVRARSGCWVAMHHVDARILAGYADGSLVLEANDSWLVACGVPSGDRAAGMLMDEGRMRSTSDLVPDILVDDGSTLPVDGRAITAAWTPGHTPGHVCYVLEDEGIVFSGDHVLPRISSHVGAYARSEVDPLGDYTRSLQRVARDFPEVEVLPGHEYRFRGLTSRVTRALAHHAERLGEVHASVRLRSAATAYEVASDISWSRGWEATTGVLRRLALAETVAHLRWLERRGLLDRNGERPIAWSSTMPDRVVTDELLIRMMIEEGEGR